MFLTTKGRYAIMAMLDMLQDSEQGGVVAVKEMAQRQNLSVYYLEQLFSLLKKHDIVKSIKGPGGGYSFNKSASDIFLSEILGAVGENIKITRCNKTDVHSCNESIYQSKCNSHLLWVDLGNYLERYFTNTSLADVANKNFFYKK